MEALANSDRALALNPNDASFWHSKGLTLFELERYEEALVTFDCALTSTPTMLLFGITRAMC